MTSRPLWLVLGLYLLACAICIGLMVVGAATGEFKLIAIGVILLVGVVIGTVEYAVK